MLKKLFLALVFAPCAALSALAVVGVNPNSGGRPSVATNAQSRFVGGVGAGGTIGYNPVGLVSAPSSLTKNTNNTQNMLDELACQNPLPDQISQARCISKYLACVRQDTVCGEHFENCDTKKKFRQKRVFCDERLLECPDEGINALFGTPGVYREEGATADTSYDKITSTPTPKTCDGETKIVKRTFKAGTKEIMLSQLEYTKTSMLGTEIEAGQVWLAQNSATACTQVADNCIKRACQNAPWKCLTSEKIGATNVQSLVKFDANGDTGSNYSVSGGTSLRVPEDQVKNYLNNMLFDDANVKNYLKGQCMTDIGGSKACYLIVNGKVPSEVIDDFDMMDVYNNVLPGRITANQMKIFDWLGFAVGTAVSACTTAATDCVKQSCGSGSLAGCYGSSLDGTVIKIQTRAYSDNCASIVYSNQNCRDVLGDKTDDSAGTSGGSTAAVKMWTEVWGTGSGSAFSDTGKFGLVGKLNTELAAMFNETTVKALFMQCRNEAESCVRRECGTGYKNCYINDNNKALTDLWSGYGTTTGSASSPGFLSATAQAAGGFDDVMARDLCLIPVKRSESCNAYFDIEYAKANKANFSSAGAWGALSGALRANPSTSWSEASGSGWSTSADGKSQTQTVYACSALKNYTFTETQSRQKDCAASGITIGACKDGGTTCTDAADKYTEADCAWGSWNESSSFSDITGKGNNIQNARQEREMNSRCAAEETSLFANLTADIAATARAQLTKEQNIVKNRCEAHRGQSSMNSTYLWAKRPDMSATTGLMTGFTLLQAGAGPNNSEGEPTDKAITQSRNYAEQYATFGLQDKRQPTGTADLFGAFCQVEVRMTSSDRAIKRFLEGEKMEITIFKDDFNQANNGKNGFEQFWANLENSFNKKSELEKTEKSLASSPVAYFALGDAIMCGSWLRERDIDILGEYVAGEELKKGEASRDWASKNAGWIGAAIGAIGGGIGGGLLANKLAKDSDARALRDNPMCDPDIIQKSREKVVECQAVVRNNLAIMRADPTKHWTASNDKCVYDGVKGLNGADKSIIVYKLAGGDVGVQGNIGAEALESIAVSRGANIYDGISAVATAGAAGSNFTEKMDAARLIDTNAEKAVGVDGWTQQQKTDAENRRKDLIMAFVSKFSQSTTTGGETGTAEEQKIKGMAKTAIIDKLKTSQDLGGMLAYTSASSIANGDYARLAGYFLNDANRSAAIAAAQQKVDDLVGTAGSATRGSEIKDWGNLRGYNYSSGNGSAYYNDTNYGSESVNFCDGNDCALNILAVAEKALIDFNPNTYKATVAGSIDLECSKYNDGTTGRTIAGAAIGAAVTGTVAGFATQMVADSAFRIQQQKNADAKMQAWFESVGSKIQCIVGGNIVGSYGDLIRLE